MEEEERQQLIERWGQIMNTPNEDENTLENIYVPLLPVAQQVAAQTVGLDLVAVQPLPAPNPELFYIDYGDDIFSGEKIVFNNSIEDFFNDITFDDYGNQDKIINNARRGF